MSASILKFLFFSMLLCEIDGIVVVLAGVGSNCLIGGAVIGTGLYSGGGGSRNPPNLRASKVDGEKSNNGKPGGGER